MYRHLVLFMGRILKMVLAGIYLHVSECMRKHHGMIDFNPCMKFMGSRKGPIIKIDNSKITYSSQLEAVGLMNALFDL